jgi:hypothetical protein
MLHSRPGVPLPTVKEGVEPIALHERILPPIAAKLTTRGHHVAIGKKRVKFGKMKLMKKQYWEQVVTSARRTRTSTIYRYIPRM